MANAKIKQVENGLDERGYWVAHWMSGAQEAFAEPGALLASVGAPETAETELRQDYVGMWHFRATWPHNGPVKYHAEGCPRWEVVGMQRQVTTSLREAIGAASWAYLEQFGRWPSYAYVSKIPKGAEDLMALDEGMILIRAGWVPERCVLVW